MGVWAVDVVGWKVLCEWRWKLTTDCFSFVCKKSCNVISCYRSGGRWWRGTEERIKCSEEITHIWSTVDLVVEMWRFGSVDFCGERWKQRFICILRSDWIVFDFCHFLSATWSLVRCSRRTSDNQGLEGAVRAGLEERGQMLSRQEVKVEHKVSVAAFTSSDEKWVGKEREEDITEERWEGERVRLKLTGRGVGGTRVAKCNVNLMKKWSEICSGCTRMLSAVQSRVSIKWSWLPDLWVLVVVRRLRSNKARSEWKSVA